MRNRIAKGLERNLEQAIFVPTIKLDGRDLQAADLSRADLRGVVRCNRARRMRASAAICCEFCAAGGR